MARGAQVAVAALLCAAASAHAAVTPPTLPPGFEETALASGFVGPTAVTWAPDGRMFVAEKAGRVRVVSSAGVVRAQPLLDIRTRVNTDSDRGLLGIATDRGSGSDAQGPASLAWAVTRHRAGSTEPVAVAGDRFAVPLDAAVDDWYSIVLTATDSAGLTDTDSVRIDPRTGRVSLRSDPAGAELSWNGELAPASLLAVVGGRGTVGAPAAFATAGRRWLFASWSDGGAREHDLTVAPGDLALVASYGAEPLAPSEPPRGQAEVPQPPGPDPGTPTPDPPQPPGPDPGTPTPDPPLPDPVPPDPGPPDPPLVELQLPASGLRMTSRGAIRLRLRNRTSSAAIGVLELVTAAPVVRGRSSARRVRLAHVAFIVAPGAERRLVVRLSAANRRLVRKLRRVRVTVGFEARDRAGTRGSGGAAATVLVALRR